MRRPLAPKQTSEHNFWKALGARYRIAVGEILRPSQSVRIVVLAISIILFGLIPALPEGANLRVLMAAQWVVVGVPLFILFFIPIELFFFRNFPVVDKIYLVIFASLFPAIIITTTNITMDFEFARLNLPAWQRIAIGTFVCSLVSGFVHFNRSPNLDHHLLTVGKHPGHTTKTGPVPLAPLMNLLPPEKRGDLLELAVKDRLVSIRTSNGTHVTRGPISELVKVIPIEKGILIHRSHWVAFVEMDQIFFMDGNPRLQLKDGSLRPVSCKKVQIIKDKIALRRE